MSRELALSVQCCRSAFRGDDSRVALDSEGIDWPLFVDLIRFHRIQGLVWAGIQAAGHKVPDEVSSIIVADAEAIAATNLRAALASRDLLTDFGQAGISVTFFKGLTLGTLAYGNALIKSAVDIDLLVDDDHLPEAVEVLRQRGYRSAIPKEPVTSRQLLSWHRLHKESTWTRSRPESQVDLHTRLADSRRLLPDLGLKSPQQTVEVAKGVELPTLQLDELFAYLCVHGASSAWFRLKWITDLAALLHRGTAEEIRRLHRRSQELRAGRAAAQALLLSDALYETLQQNGALRQQLSSDPANSWLARAALKQLTGRGRPVEPTSRPLGTARIHLTQFFLLPDLGFKASELARQFRTAFD
jgi:hypothetical protein